MDNFTGEKENKVTHISIHTQVIIMGAGPAGAGTSIFLTKAGIPHVILEKDDFPRDKICGDACSGKTVFVLRKANPAWVDDIFKNTLQNTPSHGVIFASPNGKTLAIPFNPDKVIEGQAPGFLSPRMIFDNFLFDKIPSPYATVYQHVSVKTIEREKGKGIKVCFTQDNTNYELSAPLIIGADGDKSQVRKILLNKNIADKAYCVGLRGYYKGVTGMHEKNFIELHFLKDIMPGYLWIFPLSGGLTNIGIGIMSDKIREKKINLREVMLDAIKNNPNISHRFTDAELIGKIGGWGLPLWLQRQPLSGDNFLLAGDAAGLIDPFTGEGIGNALYSGMLAAIAAEASLKAGNYEAAFIKGNYDDVLFKRIGAELKMSVLLQRLCYFPWLFNFVVKKAHKSPTLNAALTSMFTDLDLRKQLRKPSFYAKIVFNK